MYCAYSQQEVVALFENFRSLMPPRADALIDYFGAVISPECAPYLAARVGTKIDTPPFPDDTIRATFIEYLALVDSVRLSEKNLYQMCELGASYAPFSVLAGLLAIRSGIQKIVLRPVEASESGAPVIEKNFRVNGLYENESVDIEITNAAVCSRFETLYFPSVDCTIDNGGAATSEHIETDVRGAKISHVKVSGVPVDYILDKCIKDAPIDLLHVDIQGGEEHTIPDAIGLLNVKIRRMLIATHSRVIEGTLLVTLARNGWNLIAEEPTKFKFNPDIKSFTGITTSDGSQYWVNPRLTT